RDLKPGNIMLGKYGETLVVDWGLAKTIGAQETATDTVELPIRPSSSASTTETQMGRVVGTPAYMSPEQACGRLDLLSPATDIYSLGATLYHILCGVAPFGRDDQDDLLSKVQTARYLPPRQRRPETPRALEAICLKAMALEPSDRYRSAAALAEDVERYMADEPVQAYVEPWLMRVGRWMRNHRPLVYSAAAVLVVTAIALSLGVVLLGAANRREMAQRQRAETNFELARNAVRDYYISISEETLLNQEGMQTLRDQLLGQALEYYQQFLETETDDPSLRGEMAQANFYVGSIREKITSAADALPYLLQAKAIYEDLAASNPDDLQVSEMLGKTLNAIGATQYSLRRPDEALDYYRKAEQVRQNLVKKAPDDVQYVRLLANTIMNQGILAIDDGDVDEVLRLWTKAQNLREAHLREGDPEHFLLQQDVAKGNFNFGNFFLEIGRVRDAEQYLRSAVSGFEQIVQSQPNHIDSRYRLALAYQTLASLSGDEQPLDELIPYFDRSFELLRNLSLRNPEVPRYREQMGFMQLTLAERLQENNRLQEALTALDNATAAWRQLNGQYPEDASYQLNLAVVLRVSGQLHLSQIDDASQRAMALETL
ncbi:MAG: tetratricopeptide repeat protein, partial [Planctomycetales bacterium]|nr:tetratricopeptide repeat protein [Planctomycetales bacterium]